MRSEQLRVVGQKIIDNAENVYYLGEPSKVLIKVFLPSGIKSININSKSITFTIYSESGPSDIVVPSHVNMSGSIRTSMGYQYLSIENKGGYVNISEK
mgnify:CR=1 FL=1